MCHEKVFPVALLHLSWLGGAAKWLPISCHCDWLFATSGKFGITRSQKQLLLRKPGWSSGDNPLCSVDWATAAACSGLHPVEFVIFPGMETNYSTSQSNFGFSHTEKFWGFFMLKRNLLWLGMCSLPLVLSLAMTEKSLPPPNKIFIHTDKIPFSSVPLYKLKSLSFLSFFLNKRCSFTIFVTFCSTHSSTYLSLTVKPRTGHSAPAVVSAMLRRQEGSPPQHAAQTQCLICYHHTDPFASEKELFFLHLLSLWLGHAASPFLH